MAELTSTDGVSPLDQIRFVEGEVTRKLALARQASAQAVAEAHKMAAGLQEQAREEYKFTEEIRSQEIMLRAEEEAQKILAGAHRQAAELRQKGEACMEEAVEQIVSLVLGLKQQGGADES